MIQATKDLPEIRALRGQTPPCPDLQDRLGKLGRKAKQGLQARLLRFQVQQAHKVLQVTKALQAHKEFRDQQEMRGPQEKSALPAHRVLQEALAQRVMLVLQD